jgi:Ca2+-dependent lipid-binding protein
MATSILWVRIISASLEDKDPGAVQVTARIGSSTHSSHKQPSPNPQWNECLSFVVNNLGDNLTLELHRVQMLFGRKLLGLATIPLHSIRHSNRVNMCVYNTNKKIKTSMN